MPLYTFAYDPESLAEHHVYTLLNVASIKALMGNAGLNTVTGRPQLYPRRAPQAGAVEPFGIYAMASVGMPQGGVGDYSHTDGLWMVKWIGFDYQEDVLKQLNKLALDQLEGTDAVYAGLGRIIECYWESTPAYPEEELEGGGIILQRGHEFRIKAQPEGA